MALLVLTLNIYIKNIYRLAKKAAGRHTKKTPGVRGELRLSVKGGFRKEIDTGK
jgi:hypothetical protein